MIRRVGLAAVLMIALTTLPYLIALAATPPGSVFSSAILDRIDVNSHLAKMEQGERGAWLYSLLFTDRPHPPIAIQTFYIALGHVARWTGLSLILVYHLARIVCVGLMVFALWAFLTHYLTPDGAFAALLLCLFGGGIGFVLFFIAPALTRDIAPIEFWLLDAYTFLGSFALPHFAAGIALLAVGMLAIDRWTGGGARGSLLTLWLAALGIAILQPFDLLLLDLVLVIAVIGRIITRQIKPIPGITGLALVGISHAALGGYTWLALHSDPVWQSFNDQNVTLSPPPMYYVLGYGPLLLPAILGLWHILHGKEGRWLVPVAWLVVVAILVYFPIATQRRFLLGVQAPMAALAVFWLADYALPASRRRFRRRYRLAVVGYGTLAMLSTVLLLAWLLGKPASDGRTLYDSTDEVAALNWISANTPADAVLLSDFETGGKIPADTGRRVVLGHWIETPDYERTRSEVEIFYAPDTGDAWRRDYLRAHHVDYVWFQDTPAPDAAYLQSAFESGSVRIFRVVP
ncbi:MAG TPA: hypothetical protein VMT34_02635 [Aggregatilineales bacterium]|nr:hypothetical protein [Aggregatilineales bacterium]